MLGLWFSSESKHRATSAILSDTYNYFFVFAELNLLTFLLHIQLRRRTAKILRSPSKVNLISKVQACIIVYVHTWHIISVIGVAPWGPKRLYNTLLIVHSCLEWFEVNKDAERRIKNNNITFRMTKTFIFFGSIRLSPKEKHFVRFIRIWKD